MNVFDQNGPKVVVRKKGSPRPAYTEDYLCHYGIKGQKWGIRRYQNEDGTLTEAGRRRVAQSGLYLKPDVKRAVKKIGKIDSTNKDKVVQENLKEYWKHHDELYDRPHAHSEKYHELWDKYKNKYASATLKDLKLKNNKRARAEVKAILKSIDPDWDSRNELDWEERKPYEERRKQLTHPKREKAKKYAKKAKEVVDTLANVKKLVTP